MKTHEEIKKGLECCTIPLCAECPYDSEASCVVKNEDALAYIQQLEAKVPKWISVEERLPEKYSPVVIAYKDSWGDMASGMGVISDRVLGHRLLPQLRREDDRRKTGWLIIMLDVVWLAFTPER